MTLFFTILGCALACISLALNVVQFLAYRRLMRCKQDNR